LDFSGYLTGHIGTEEHFQFTYGRATARMKVHPYHGAHSAFWLQSVNPYAVGRPEIDVAECFGAHNPDRESGVQMWHNVFYRPTDDSPILTARKSANSKDFGGPWHTGYHDYTVDWSPDAYRFSIDGQVTAMITEGLSDTPKYLVLSILARDFEVGEIANHPITTYLTQVKWVKVWQ
jgi:beta-glucanase (GH16 family)